MRKTVLLVLAATLALVNTQTLARKFKILESNPPAQPMGALVDSDGQVFVPTYGGGETGRGTVFRINNDGKVKVLCDFSDGNGAAFPSSRLLRDQAGDLFGVASRIGDEDFGTAVFKISHGHEIMLHFFGEGSGALGGPQAGLAMDVSGNIYGVTATGGAAKLGTVFKITPDGTTSVLHEFSGLDGKWPAGDLMIDASGNIVGTTFAGGAEDAGTIFRIAPDGGAFAQLHSFVAATEGREIYAGLVDDERGNFYGTTSLGGLNGGGTVFKFSAKGKLSVLHTFNGADGYWAQGTLVRDAAGNLYGITEQGGEGYGIAFRLAPNGKMTTLHTFTGGADGAMPVGGLSMDAAGNLYGGTVGGSPTVFEIQR